MKSVYLAGGRGSDWRNDLRSRWSGRATVVDPFSDCPQDYIYEFTGADLSAIAQCDVVIGYSDFPRYTGMALEFGYAAALRKPIVYVCELPRIDSMMVGVSSAAFTDLAGAIDFVEERYL